MDCPTTTSAATKAKLSVEKVDIIGTCGSNRQPVSGDVWFSDGQSYGFLVVSEIGGGIAFSGHRVRHGAHENFSFRSNKREKLLFAHLGLV